jgi:hypothetical protein
MNVFISHSSKNRKTAGRLGDDLTAARIHVWLDRDDLRSGDPLLDELQDALEASTHLLLLWSKPASESRYVKAEWQAAYDLQKTIIPCLLDGTKLPVFLRRPKFCDMRRSYASGWKQIAAALHANVKPLRAVRAPAVPADKQAAIDRLAQAQETILLTANRGDLESARRLQRALGPDVKRALARWGKDETILNLAGYQLKNAYQLKYWNQLSKQRYPKDPLLAKAEQLFHAALGIRPDDPSAKNGLGNIFWFRRDLDAAEFFVRHAIAGAQRQGFRYDAAEHDLAIIRQEKSQRRTSRARTR